MTSWHLPSGMDRVDECQKRQEFHKIELVDGRGKKSVWAGEVKKGNENKV